MRDFLKRFAAILVVGMLGEPVRAQVGDVQHVHDPCIIKDGDSYYLFSTGHGIPIRRSHDLFRWEVIGRVFSQDVPDWAEKDIPDAEFPWAPDISFFDGQYHLYYSISTFGSNRSCIGLATNKTLDPGSSEYRWADHGKVTASRPGRDDFNAIDPNLVIDQRGRPWLAFGSFWSGIKLLQVDRRTGKPGAEGEDRHSIATRPGQTAIEAPFIARKNGHYYLFASFDFCCKGVNSTYNIVVG